MCVVRVISSCKQAMTINCFSLVLSSLFCPLFVTFFTIGFAFPYFSCCSVLQLSFHPHLLRHRHTKEMGSCRGLAACNTPAALGWLTPLSEQVPSTKYQMTPAGAGCGWVCWQERSARGGVRFCCHKTLSAIFSCSL